MTCNGKIICTFDRLIYSTLSFSFPSFEQEAARLLLSRRHILRADDPNADYHYTGLSLSLPISYGHIVELVFGATQLIFQCGSVFLKTSVNHMYTTL